MKKSLKTEIVTLTTILTLVLNCYTVPRTPAIETEKLNLSPSKGIVLIKKK